MSASKDVGRRRAIALMGQAAVAAAAATARPVTAASPVGAPIDFTRLQDRLKAYMLMRGALDDRLVIGCVSGSYFGVVGDEITPLWDVVSATFARYRPRPDGGYDGFTLEYAHFIDPATREAPGRFRNPYTEAMIDEPQGGYAPAKISILPDLGFRLGREIPGMTMNHEIRAAQMRGNDVWIPEFTTAVIAAPGAAKPLRYSEMVTLHARRDELEASGARRVACETAFTNVVSWRPWMKMGDRPGHLTATGAGCYGTSLETLPPEWIAATRRKRPELLDNPGRLLDPLWNAK